MVFNNVASYAPRATPAPNVAQSGTFCGRTKACAARAPKASSEVDLIVAAQMIETEVVRGYPSLYSRPSSATGNVCPWSVVGGVTSQPMSTRHFFVKRLRTFN